MATDPVLEVWLKGPEHLVQQVERWFREATELYTPPNKDGCLLFAEHLHGIGPAGDPPEPDSRGLAFKAGEKFSKQIAQERESLEKWVRFAKLFSGIGELDDEQDIIRRIYTIEHNLDIVLPYFAKCAKREEPIRSLARVAREVWAETNRAKIPLWKYPNSPLCEVIEQGLAALGYDHPRREGIAAILKGKARRKR